MTTPAYRSHHTIATTVPVITADMVMAISASLTHSHFDTRCLSSGEGTIAEPFVQCNKQNTRYSCPILLAVRTGREQPRQAVVAASQLAHIVVCHLAWTPWALPPAAPWAGSFWRPPV